MRKSHLFLHVAFLAFLFLIVPSETKAQSSFQISFGPVFTVNTTTDTVDASVGDGLCADSKGRCTLRAAIEESNYEPVANANSINFIIFALPNPAVIDLTLGELNITSGMSVIGPGARRLTVQRSLAPGTANFRVFRVASNGVGVDIGRMSIRNGSAGNENGGGILVDSTGTLTLTDVAVSGNSAANGGGIANDGRYFVVNRVLVNANNAAGKGGGIFNQGSSPFSGPRISNSTITNNAASNGGGVYNNGGIYLANNTISSNTATVAATSVFNESGTFSVLNTIIGRDAGSSIPSLSGAFASKGNNIVTDARNSKGFTNGMNNDQVSDNNAIDPVLGSLADNGGHTDTRALLAGSPAIDAGSDCVLTDSCPEIVRMSLASDQRGRYQRKFGNTVDIGAFEAGPSVPLESISFGLTPRPGTPAFFGGAIAVLTSATTNEKIYGSINPFGAFRFQNIPADYYILEMLSKRANIGGGLLPIGLDEILPGLSKSRFNLGENLSGYRFMVNK